MHVPTWTVVPVPFPMYIPMYIVLFRTTYRYNNVCECGDMKQNDSQTWRPSVRSNFICDISTRWHNHQEGEQLVKLGVLELQLGSKWAAPMFIMSNKMAPYIVYECGYMKQNDSKTWESSPRSSSISVTSEQDVNDREAEWLVKLGVLELQLDSK